jgi:hypothetical protein
MSSKLQTERACVWTWSVTSGSERKGEFQRRRSASGRGSASVASGTVRRVMLDVLLITSRIAIGTGTARIAINVQCNFSVTSV